MTEIDNLDFMESPKSQNNTKSQKRLNPSSIVLIVGILAVALVLGIQLSRQNEVQ